MEWFHKAIDLLPVVYFISVSIICPVLIADMILSGRRDRRFMFAKFKSLDVKFKHADFPTMQHCIGGLHTRVVTLEGARWHAEQEKLTASVVSIPEPVTEKKSVRKLRVKRNSRVSKKTDLAPLLQLGAETFQVPERKIGRTLSA